MFKKFVKIGKNKRVPVRIKLVDRSQTRGEDEMDKERIWESVKKFPPFWDYCRNMDDRFNVQRIDIDSWVWFGQRIGLMTVSSIINDSDGMSVPGFTFLRGPSVAVLLLLRDEKDKDHAVLTRQARAPVGEYEAREIVAGTIDGDANFTGKAAKEVKEETGLEIRPEELIDLTVLVFGEDCQGVNVSPGGTDEKFRIMLCIKKLASFEIESMKNRLAGVKSEHEKIRLEISPYEELRGVSDAKTIIAKALYETLTREGRKF